MGLALALLLLWQDPAALVDRLKSESIEEREQAYRKLLELGEDAQAALEKRLGDSDPELAGRVAILLRRLELRRILGPKLLKALPGLDLKLAVGSDADWARTLLEATEQKHTWRRHPDLESRDLDPLVARALRGATPEQRPQICRLAGLWTLKSGVPELIPLLEQSGEVEREAIHALRLCGARLPDSLLRPLLRSPSDWTLNEVIRLVRNEQASGLLEDLMALLKASDLGDSSTASALMEAIGSCGNAGTIAELIDLSASGKLKIGRGSIAAALSAIDGDQALAALLLSEKKGGEDGRLPALELICGLNTPKVLPELRRCLRDGDIHPVYQALAAIVRLELRELAPEVRVLLDDPAGLTRHNAAWTLAQLGDSSALPVLLPKLEPTGSPHSLLRAIAGLDARPAFPRLLEFIEGGQGEAAFILARQGGPEEIEKLVGAVRKRTELAYALALAGRKEALPFLVAGLKKPDAVGKSMAAAGLGLLSLAETAGPLSDAAKEEAISQTRYMPAIRALGRVAGKNAVPQLLPLLDHSDEWHRQAALVSLEAARAWEGLPKVRVLLTDDSAIVREQAACWLLAAGSAEGAPTLLPSGSRLFYLNAIRRRAAWVKLAARRFDAPLWLTGRRGLEEIAAAAGLRMETPPGFLGPWPSLVPESLDAPSALGETSIILEDGVLRVLPEREAQRFWRAWWETEAKQK